MATSPRVIKASKPYPVFPQKLEAKKKRVYPLEDSKEFKERTEIMAAYFGSLQKIQARFNKPGRISANVVTANGVIETLTKTEVKRLFTLLQNDVKALHGFYDKARSLIRKGRKGTGGFSAPSFMSQNMLDFLSQVDLGALYNADGSVAADDIKGVMQFLVEASPMYRVVSPSTVMILFSIYNMTYGLNRLSRRNQEAAARGDKQSGSWLGADENLMQYFGQDIETATAKGQVQLDLEIRNGGGVGQVRRFKADGVTPAPPVKANKDGIFKPKPTQLFYPFSSDNFQWSNISAAFVTPNVNKDLKGEVATANAFIDTVFPDEMTAEQRAVIQSFEEQFKDLKKAGGGTDALALAMQVTKTRDDNALYEVNAPLLVKAISYQTEAVLKASKQGLEIANKVNQ